MEYLLGALMTVVFFICVGGAYWLGMKRQQPKAKPPDVDEEKRRLIEKHNEHFKALMNYDVPTALKRKQVTE